MAVYTTWWKASNDGVNWTDMPSPSSFKYTPNDLDNDTYRSVVTGVLIRNRVRAAVGKWELSFNAITENDLGTILNATSNAAFYVQIRTGGNLSSTRKVYAGTPSIEAIEGTQRWNLSFSLIQY